jgi:hypothetical protein
VNKGKSKREVVEGKGKGRAVKDRHQCAAGKGKKLGQVSTGKKEEKGVEGQSRGEKVRGELRGKVVNGRRGRHLGKGGGERKEGRESWCRWMEKKGTQRRNGELQVLRKSDGSACVGVAGASGRCGVLDFKKERAGSSPGVLVLYK